MKKEELVNLQIGLFNLLMHFKKEVKEELLETEMVRKDCETLRAVYEYFMEVK